MVGTKCCGEPQHEVGDLRPVAGRAEASGPGVRRMVGFVGRQQHALMLPGKADTRFWKCSGTWPRGTTLPVMVKKHDDYLVGAYGMFWAREGVLWNPGSGATWQLLGQRNKRAPALRVCDFRTARGVYILYNDHGPTYTGIARGEGGLGARLKTHDSNEPRGRSWTRFSWFSFDRVVDDPEYVGWEYVDLRTQPVPTDDDMIIREMEALLINVLGTEQNSMKFQRAKKWSQLLWQDARRLRERQAVDPTPFLERRD